MASNKATRLTLLCSARTTWARQAIFGGAGEIENSEIGKLARLKSELTAGIASVSCGPDFASKSTAGYLGKRAQTEPLLADLDYGSWTGRSLASVAETEPQALALWLSDPAAKPHGGESLAELYSRSRKWLHGMMNAGGHHLAVTSQAVCRAVVLNTLDAPEASFWLIDIPHLTISSLTSDGHRWSVRTAGCPVMR